MSFKSMYSFKERITETYNILQKYPERIPIICEKNSKAKNTSELDKKKYLVPCDLTIGQFIYVIRKRLSIKPEMALYIFINGAIPPSAEFIQTIYERHKDEDGFLYVTYSFENTFG